MWCINVMKGAQMVKQSNVLFRDVMPSGKRSNEDGLKTKTSMPTAREM